MRKIIVVFVIAVLLASCQATTPVSMENNLVPTIPIVSPTPRPTSSPVESLAVSIDEIEGLWGAPNSRYILINDNKVVAYVSPGVVADNAFISLSDGKITFSGSSGCKSTGIYEIYVIRQDGNIIANRTKLVGDDPCIYRKADMDGKTMFRISPRSVVPIGMEEVPAASPAEIEGVWYNGETGYFKFDGNIYHIYRGFASQWGYGRYSLTNGELHFENARDMKDCGDSSQAAYTVYLLKQNEQVLGLRFELSGNDVCTYRKEAMQNLIFTRASFE